MREIKAQGLLLFLILLLTFFCYKAGLSGPFLLDDFTNLPRLAHVDGSLNGFLLAVFGPSGEILGRPLSYLSFLLHTNDWPESAYSFKFVNVCIHLMNTVLVYLVLLQLPFFTKSKNARVAILATALWALAPLSVSTVLYVVQRMTLLAAFFSLLAIVSFLYARNARGLRFVSFTLLFFFALTCAFLSKQNGLLVIPVVVLLEYLLRDRPPASVTLHRGWMVSLKFLLVAYIATFIFYSISYLPYFSGRTFTVLERLGIQGWVMFDYIRLTVIPDISQMSLHHDDFEINVSQKAAIGAVFWMLHIALIVFVVINRRRTPCLLFCVLWFYIFHSMEASFLPLELMFEHRNYMPSIGIFLAVSWAVFSIFETARGENLRRFSLAGGLLVACSVFFLVLRVGDWSNIYRVTLKWAEYQKDSPRSQYSFVVELERAGFVDSALSEIENASSRFGRLGFAWHAWRLNCGMGESDIAKFPSKDVVERTEFTSEVLYEFELLGKLWVEGKCIPQGLTNELLDEYLDAVSNMNLLEWKPGYKAKMHEHLSQFYLDIKRVDKATEHLLLLYESQPTVDTALKNAEHALRFGLLEYADEYLGKARFLNESRPIIAANRIGEIKNLEIYRAQLPDKG